MKRINKSFLLIIGLFVVISLSYAQGGMKIWKNNICMTIYTNDVDSIVFFDSLDGHEFVDLDLPSGTLWATCNLGANMPEDYGRYFAWGENVGYTEYAIDNYCFDWAKYRYCTGTSTKMTKYVTNSTYGSIDNARELETLDDAAAVNWGADWKIPSWEQWQELYSSCRWEWTTINGINGYKVSSTNNNWIFLPAGGYFDNTSIINKGAFGDYWTSTLCAKENKSAYDFDFTSNQMRIGNDYGYRCQGHSIRPVRTTR